MISCSVILKIIRFLQVVLVVFDLAHVLRFVYAFCMIGFVIAAIYRNLYTAKRIYLQ